MMDGRGSAGRDYDLDFEMTGPGGDGEVKFFNIFEKKMNKKKGRFFFSR